MRLKDLAKKALNKRHLESITLTENDTKEAQEAIKKIEECIKEHGKCEGPLLNFGSTCFGVRLSSKKVRNFVANHFVQEGFAVYVWAGSEPDSYQGDIISIELPKRFWPFPGIYMRVEGYYGP